MRNKSFISNKMGSLLLSLVFVFFSCGVMAEAATEASAGNDIIFLLDISGSMGTTDTTKKAIDIVQMATDLCKENDRVAFVAYNDTIAYQYDFIDVSDKEEIVNLKEYISNVKYSGETDIGLGLRKAIVSLTEDGRKDANRYVIMLSDGETDLRKSNTGRTESDSQNDVEYSLKLCKENGVVVHTIGFVKSFSDSMDYLSVLSSSTGGQTKVATSPFMLLDSISGVLLKYNNGEINNIASYVSNEKENRFVIRVGEKKLDELILMIYSSGSIKKIDTEASKNQLEIIRNRNYSVVKIKNPIVENLNLTLGCEKGSNVIVNRMQYFDTQSALSNEGNSEVKDTVTKNILTKLVFSLKDEKTREVIKQKDYDDVRANIAITNIETNNCVTIQGNVEEGGISAEYIFKEKGTYNIHVLYQIGDIEGECFRVTEVVNIPPRKLKEIDETLCIDKEASIYDVEKLFENPDNDKLTYEIIEKTDSYVEALLNGSKLSVQPVGYGDSNFKIRAVDNDGASASINVQIHSQPFWKYNFGLTVGLVVLGIVFVAVLLVGIIILLNNRDKRRKVFHYSGVLTGNFVNLKSKNDIGAMRWELSQFSRESITLENLFEAADINENLPDTDQIIFYSKNEENLILVNESENSIFVNSENISRQDSISVVYGDIIYIGFCDNSIELELIFSKQ